MLTIDLSEGKTEILSNFLNSLNDHKPGIGKSLGAAAVVCRSVSFSRLSIVEI